HATGKTRTARGAPTSQTLADLTPPAPLPGIDLPDARLVTRSPRFSARADGSRRSISPLDSVIRFCFSNNVARIFVKESDSPYYPNDCQPVPPSGAELPADLAAFLESQRLACLLI